MKFLPALYTTKFPLAFCFLEARSGGVRSVGTVRERRAKSVSDRLALHARCRGKRKGFGTDPRGSVDWSG